jgi:hypothetical protein
MTADLGPLVVGAADPAVVTTFWRTVLGDEAFERHLRVEPEREAKVVKNRVHLDVYVRDVAPLLAIGARVLDDYPPTRATLADVEGNEFCAFIDRELGPTPLGRVFAVCTDSDRPADAAAWWAPLVGAEIGPGPDGVPRYLYGCAGWGAVIWKFVEVDDERVALNRWRWCVVAETDGWFTDPDGNDVSAERLARPTDRAGPSTSGEG